MMNGIVRCFGAALVITFIAGCRGYPSSPYVGPGTLNSGSAEVLTASEKLHLADEAVQKMLVDPIFSEKYQSKKATLGAVAKGTRPVLTLAPFENNTGVGNDSDLKQMAFHLRDKLRKSGLFEVLDDLQTPEMFKRLLRTDLGENDDALQVIGTLRAPDYFLQGSVVREPDGRGYMFSLNLSVLDCTTRQIFWSDTVRLPKKDH